MSQSRHPLVSPHEMKPEALTKRASRCGAVLTITTKQTLMVRLGASSWHCVDPSAAVAVLRNLEARVQRQQEGSIA